MLILDQFPDIQVSSMKPLKGLLRIQILANPSLLFFIME